jgi:hypothetical protein
LIFLTVDTESQPNKISTFFYCSLKYFPLVLPLIPLQNFFLKPTKSIQYT